jgi:hypothetical protein
MSKHHKKGEHHHHGDQHDEKQMPPYMETNGPYHDEAHIFYPEHDETQSRSQWPPIIAPFMEPPQREPAPEPEPVHTSNDMPPFAQPGVDLVEWSGFMDACALCRANMNVGAVPDGYIFPSGHTDAPAHDNCRCMKVYVNTHAKMF